jgi:predicted dehydrogenase
MSSAVRQIIIETATGKPRLGFAGLGWIGRNRLQSVVQAGVAEVAAVHDVHVDALQEALTLTPDAVLFSSFEELLHEELDGVVIATPNCFHAEQSIAALEAGIPVFCQKPLGRNADETRRIVAAARHADCLLGVDLSYRAIPAMKAVSQFVVNGELGHVFAVDARFHNGYGPDKAWFRDYSLSGGGCVLDLGSHLLDLALRPLGFPQIERVESSLFTNGKLLEKGSEEVEDYAVATIETVAGTVINLSCCWNMHIGRDAEIEIAFYGTDGGAKLLNIDGSFYDFAGERFRGTTMQMVSSAENENWEWGGLATIEWIERLAAGGEFDAEAEQFVTLAEVIDRIYGRE